MLLSFNTLSFLYLRVNRINPILINTGMKKQFVKVFFTLSAIMLFLCHNADAQGYTLKFSRVIDTNVILSIPCNVSHAVPAYYELWTNPSQIVKIESIQIETWQTASWTAATVSCGPMTGGSLNVFPALKKDYRYIDISTSKIFTGPLWIKPGTIICAKVLSTITANPYINSTMNLTVHIDGIEFLRIP